MTPREFLEQVVMPNVEDLKANYASLRHAYNAVAAADALAAHIFAWLKLHDPIAVAACSDDTQYRAEIAKGSYDFGLLRDLAKALKHVELVYGKPSVSNAAQMVTRPIGYGEGGYGEGRFGGPPQTVVGTNSGDLHYVENVIGNALAALEITMKAHYL